MWSPKYLLQKCGKLYCKKTCQYEFHNPRFKKPNERPIEFSFLFKSLTNTWPSSVLDVGAGLTALPHLIANCGFRVTAIDNIDDYWREDAFNRHYHIIHDDIVNTALDKTFDFINCISVLEHIHEHDKAIDSIISLLNPGGHLLLTFPYCESTFTENVYKLDGAGYGQNAAYICRVFSRSEINSWLKRHGLRIIDSELWQIFTGKYWTFGSRLNPPQKADKDSLHHLGCFLIQKPH